ncbi:PHP domain-containing protein [Thermodesulfobacteriota bacterium]
MTTFNGWFHVHSNHSFDGEHSLTEIRDLALARGFRFLIMAEHRDDFGDEGRYESYRAECESLSDDAFTIVPGLEFRCQYAIEVLAVGLRRLLWEPRLAEVIEGVQGQGGVAILAHPSQWGSDFLNLHKDDLVRLDGLEVWNLRHDGDEFPWAETTAILNDLQASNPKLSAYGGLDFHRIADFDDGRFLSMEVETDRNDETSLLEAMREGRYAFKKGVVRFDSLCRLGTMKKLLFSLHYGLI